MFLWWGSLLSPSGFLLTADVLLLGLLAGAETGLMVDDEASPAQSDREDGDSGASTSVVDPYQAAGLWIVLSTAGC